MLLNFPVHQGLVALAGATFTCIGAYHIVRAFRARKWPKVLGKIDATNVIRTDRLRGALNFSEYVRYRYAVNGTSYVNDRMQFGVHSIPMTSLSDKPASDAETRALAAKLANEYRVHSPITVYYNPRRPGDSTLDTSVDSHTWATTFVGAVFAIIAILLR